MAVKSSDQVTIVDITDSYSVTLGMDSYTVPGNSSGHPSSQQTVSIPVYAYQGSTAISPTFGTITTSDTTNLTATTGGSGTEKTVSVTIKTALSNRGTVTIPVIVDSTQGTTITKTFTVSVASTGQQGTAGRGIQNTTVQYAQSTSGTEAPSTGWQDTIPTVTQGNFLWTKTYTTYTSGDPTTSYSVSKVGQDGKPGDAGRGIQSTVIEYQKSSSGTNPPTGEWSASPIETVAGEYLWTRTTTKYTSGSDTVSYAVAAHGTNGQDAITIGITSDNGTIFKNSTGNTTLTAHVYKGGSELSSSQISAIGTLKWYKDSGSNAVGTGATLSVSASNVTSKAVYTVKLESA